MALKLSLREKDAQIAALRASLAQAAQQAKERKSKSSQVQDGELGDLSAIKLGVQGDDLQAGVQPDAQRPPMSAFFNATRGMPTFNSSRGSAARKHEEDKWYPCFCHDKKFEVFSQASTATSKSISFDECTSSLTSESTGNPGAVDHDWKKGNVYGGSCAHSNCGDKDKNKGKFDDVEATLSFCGNAKHFGTPQFYGLNYHEQGTYRYQEDSFGTYCNCVDLTHSSTRESAEKAKDNPGSPWIPYFKDHKGKALKQFEAWGAFTTLQKCYQLCPSVCQGQNLMIAGCAARFIDWDDWNAMFELYGGAGLWYLAPL